MPTEILDLPQHGTLNVHASLLPRWRGAAPISAAILHGDSETGVTIMLVDETEDTGDVLRQRATPIAESENAGQLSDRLSAMGAQLLLEAIPDWLDGKITPVAQDPSQATRARRIRKQQGRIDWSQSAPQIARHIRAYTPWPAAATTLADVQIRVTAATASEATSSDPAGTILSAEDAICVATGSSTLEIHRLQRAGKRELSALEFARGARDLVGQRFGASDA